MKVFDHWQLQEAKSKLSRVVKSAKTSGAQFITVHGHEEAVVLSIKDYKELLKSKGTLVDFFQSSPLAGIDLSIERTKDYGRDTEF
jgi:antitoxin Phd